MQQEDINKVRASVHQQCGSRVMIQLDRGRNKIDIFIQLYGYYHQRDTNEALLNEEYISSVLNMYSTKLQYIIQNGGFFVELERQTLHKNKEIGRALSSGF